MLKDHVLMNCNILFTLADCTYARMVWFLDFMLTLCFLQVTNYRVLLSFLACHLKNCWTNQKEPKISYLQKVSHPGAYQLRFLLGESD